MCGKHVPDITIQCLLYARISQQSSAHLASLHVWFKLSHQINFKFSVALHAHLITVMIFSGQNQYTCSVNYMYPTI